MPHPRRDADHPAGRPAAQGHELDFDLALVVGRSHVNRIVVSRIAERAGLKTILSAPEHARQSLEKSLPGTVLLDGGNDGRDCEVLMESLAAQRLAAGGKAPFVIMVQNSLPSSGQPQKGGTVDAIVAKPITPERLLPLILSMLDRVRD